MNTAEPVIPIHKVSKLESFSEHVIPTPDLVTKPVNSYRNLRKRYWKMKRKQRKKDH